MSLARDFHQRELRSGQRPDKIETLKTFRARSAEPGNNNSDPENVLSSERAQIFRYWVSRFLRNSRASFSAPGNNPINNKRERVGVPVSNIASDHETYARKRADRVPWHINIRPRTYTLPLFFYNKLFTLRRRNAIWRMVERWRGGRGGADRGKAEQRERITRDETSGKEQKGPQHH